MKYSDEYINMKCALGKKTEGYENFTHLNISKLVSFKVWAGGSICLKIKEVL